MRASVSAPALWSAEVWSAAGGSASRATSAARSGASVKSSSVALGGGESPPSGELRRIGETSRREVEGEWGTDALLAAAPGGENCGENPRSMLEGEERSEGGSSAWRLRAGVDLDEGRVAGIEEVRRRGEAREWCGGRSRLGVDAEASPTRRETPNLESEAGG